MSELDALKRDAARYRWIRTNLSDDGQWYLTGQILRSPEELDYAIDRARIGDINNVLGPKVPS
jgi:hypothetical protein